MKSREPCPACGKTMRRRWKVASSTGKPLGFYCTQRCAKENTSYGETKGVTILEVNASGVRRYGNK